MGFTIEVTEKIPPCEVLGNQCPPCEVLGNQCYAEAGLGTGYTLQSRYGQQGSIRYLCLFFRDS